MDEILLVDVFDNVIGVEEKLKAHIDKKLHRAFSLFIVNGGKMLLQQRALHKYHSGGKWANACCSHPKPEEEIVSCVICRAKEELGIDVSKPKKLFDFIYYSEFDNGLVEYELDNVFIVEYAGDVDFDKNEVMAIEWVDIDCLAKDLVNNPSKYSTWFLSCAPRVISMLKND